MNLSFVGRMYSSLKGFYNEINSATLTGAIDVVIVRQKDGSYLSSPFHVRFGKLGVLRSREKVVDLEINGKPVGLHMKLGEAGEAFFVQEIKDDVDIPLYLATSPIESGDEVMSEDLMVLKNECSKQELHAKLYHNADQTTKSKAQKISTVSLPHSNFHAEYGVVSNSLFVKKDIKSDSSIEDKYLDKPLRRKVLKKKKNKSSTRFSLHSHSVPEGLVLCDQELNNEIDAADSTTDEDVVASFDIDCGLIMSSDVKNYDRHKQQENCVDSDNNGVERCNLLLNGRHIRSFDSFCAPFSEPDMTPSQSPLPSRPPSPMSDTEIDRQHVEEKHQQHLKDSSATWDWGQLPKQPLSPNDCKMDNQQIDNFLDRKDLNNTSSSGLLSLLRKHKNVEDNQMMSAKAGRVVEKGIYLEDLTTMEDPEVAKLYLGKSSFPFIRDHENEDGSESGHGTSVTQSPHSVDGSVGGSVSFLQSEVRHLGTASMSLCGGLADAEPMSLDSFMKKVITYDDLVEQPNLINNPDLVIKVRDGYYNWITAAPMLLCEMVFNRPLPDHTLTSLTKKNMPKKSMKKKGSWWSWRSSTAHAHSSAMNSTSLVDQENFLSEPSNIYNSDVAGVSHKEGVVLDSHTDVLPHEMFDSCHAAQPVVKHFSVTLVQNQADIDSNKFAEIPLPKLQSLRQNDDTSVILSTEEQPTGTMLSECQLGIETSPPCDIATLNSLAITEPIENGSECDPLASMATDQVGPVTFGANNGCVKGLKVGDRFIKTLRLTSKQVERLNLWPGQNDIVYSVTTQYQGTTRCMCHIYLWNYDDNIVISDIDGTITKSDVVGQILPLIGRDWSHSGVAHLFSHLHGNGYKLLYLSARAIGQSRSTKEMLRSIKQGNLVLPEGPLLLNPTSLISAFHREVIVRKSEEFKISCLKDICALFPASPFYAGFGNRISDVITYRELKIPSFRIFTINPHGQLRHDLSHTFLSSYSGMSDVADHFFPPVSSLTHFVSNEFSHVNYWRTPLPVVDVDAVICCSAPETTPVSSLSTDPTAVTIPTVLDGKTPEILSP